MSELSAELGKNEDKSQNKQEDISYVRNIFETPHFRLAHKSDDTYDIMYLGYNVTITPERVVSRIDVLNMLLKVYVDCEKEQEYITYMKSIVVNAIGQLLREEIDKDKTLEEFEGDKKEFEEFVKSGV